MITDKVWQTKLHARLHDPAEKALVLLRDPAGHEGGTSRELHRLLFEGGVSDDIHSIVKKADWWASAADRPQWPEEAERLPDGRTVRRPAAWSRVNWAKEPTLIHPMNGGEVNLGNDFGVDVSRLAATDVEDIKARSLDHFRELRLANGQETDWRRTLLAYWRFGPELREGEDNGTLGELWRLLPADTRIPDHSIWDHLDLVSAFAGAFSADENGDATLLTVSLGPVQGFIAAARTTSDLWAGSHILAQLAWQAMRVICERLGPDAILLPRLRGIPQVDVWLREECDLPRKWFDDCEWTKQKTDANPLFSAALPNRFVAVVPAGGVTELATCIETRTRDWLQEVGGEVVDKLLEAVSLRRKDEPRDDAVPAYQQMRDQLNGFPEVHWAAVPFSLIRPRNQQRQTNLDTSRLVEATAPFFGAEHGEESGFLASPAWKVLCNPQELNGATFFDPNPGVLYPAVYDLAERALAAAKVGRSFDQTEHVGWRCSMTGETEWLTTDRGQLVKSYRTQPDTLWAKVADQRPAWAKRGEHLGALPAIKRLWPSLFAKRLRRVVGTQGADRFVVSTHTMALAKQMEEFVEGGGQPTDEQRKSLKGARPVALPRRLARHHHSLDWMRRLPGCLEDAAEAQDEERKRCAEVAVKGILGDKIESYYALLLMDGDHMGRTLAGGNSTQPTSYLQSFHPSVRQGFEKLASGNPALEEYANAPRAVSPNRHLSISAALNDFALHVVPQVVEHEHAGRVLYAGGDDVMAMLPVVDLLPAMRRLREAYSGDAREAVDVDWAVARKRRKLVCKGGFAYLRGRLMCMMAGATASCGAVVAHHKEPLAVVMSELHRAEKRAKDAGRNRFSLTVIKRGGGDLLVTDKWDAPLDALLKARDFLAEPSVSRRAVYNSLAWLKDLPDDASEDMLCRLMVVQFERQAQDESARRSACELARLVAALAAKQPSCRRRAWLTQHLCVAEFLARETRTESAGTAEESASAA